VTDARPPSSPTLGFVVAEPALLGAAAVGADEAALARVDGPAHEQAIATAGQVPANPPDAVLSGIHDRIATALTTGSEGAGVLAPDIQNELAHLLALLPQVAAAGDPLLLRAVDLALLSLLARSPNVVFARSARLTVAQRLGIYPSLRWALTSSPIPAVRVMSGLLVVVLLALPVLAATVFLLRAHFADLNSASLDLDDLILFGIFGAAGSVISIMVRIDEFNRWPPDPSILFFTGLFKPIIGFFFAIFVLLVLNSGILQIGLAEERQAYFFLATAFIAGFSERFARDIATQTESFFPGSAEQPGRPARGAVSPAEK
jgi:hypothetical protein